MDKIRKILCVCVPQNIFLWYRSQKPGGKFREEETSWKKRDAFRESVAHTPVLPAGRFGNNAENTVLKYRKNAKSLFTIR